MGCLSWQHSWLRLLGLERQYCSSSWIIAAVAAAGLPFVRTALGLCPASRLRCSFLFDDEMSLARWLIDFGQAVLFAGSTWPLEHRSSSTAWRCSRSDSLSAKIRWRSMANSSSPSFASCFPSSSSSSFDDFK